MSYLHETLTDFEPNVWSKSVYVLFIVAEDIVMVDLAHGPYPNLLKTESLALPRQIGRIRLNICLDGSWHELCYRKLSFMPLI